MHAPSRQRELFELSAGLPEGLIYRPHFLAPADAESLLAEIGSLALAEARYKAFTARRRIVSFGAGYDFATNALLPAPPLPAVLHPLREQVSAWSGIPAADLRQCTVAEYRPGTQLGWHRDVPRFEHVVGISLVSACRMRLRPHPHVKHAKGRGLVLVLVLEPCSAYVLRDDARWRWQHAISPTTSLRYSITFRTFRGK